MRTRGVVRATSEVLIPPKLFAVYKHTIPSLAPTHPPVGRSPTKRDDVKARQDNRGGKREDEGEKKQPLPTPRQKKEARYKTTNPWCVGSQTGRERHRDTVDPLGAHAAWAEPSQEFGLVTRDVA